MPPSRRTGRKARDAPGPGPTASEPETSALTGRLTELGFTQNESRVYLTLVEADRLTAAEVAVGASVPRPKVYEALSSLESRGFCRSEGGRVSRYTAVEPGAALEAWIRHRDLQRVEQADHDRENVATLLELLPKLPRPNATEIPDFIEGITGRLPTTEALEQLMARARTSLVEMLQPPFLQPRARWNVMEIQALQRGVTVCVVYTPAALEDRRRYEDLLEQGGELRVVDQLPMKLLIRDDEEALISLRDMHTGAQGVSSALVRHRDLVRPLRKLFDETWSHAQPLTS